LDQSLDPGAILVRAVKTDCPENEPALSLIGSEAERYCSEARQKQ
jgi:hypothetical protein